MRDTTCSGDGCDDLIDSARNKSGFCKQCFRKDYYQRNKAHENASNKTYRDARPEYWKMRWQIFSIQNRDILNAANKARYEADPEKYRQFAAEWRRRNPGKSDAWRKQNPEVWAMRNRENQRRRRRTDGEPVDYMAILDEHGMTCHICAEEILGIDDLHMDHVIPLSKGGRHSQENIKPAHAFCNLSKGAKLTA